jgi:hypothetical protein
MFGKETDVSTSVQALLELVRVPAGEQDAVRRALDAEGWTHNERGGPFGGGGGGGLSVGSWECEFAPLDVIDDWGDFLDGLGVWYRIAHRAEEGGARPARLRWGAGPGCVFEAGWIEGTAEPSISVVPIFEVLREAGTPDRILDQLATLTGYEVGVALGNYSANSIGAAGQCYLWRTSDGVDLCSAHLDEARDGWRVPARRIMGDARAAEQLRLGRPVLCVVCHKDALG